MENYMLTGIVLALVVYRYFPITEDNLLVLVDSKTEDVVELLREIHGLKSAFKVERNLESYWKDGITENETKVSNLILQIRTC